MRAAVLDEFGASGVLNLHDLDTPEPGSGQVRLRVQAAGVNPVDLGTRAGAFGAEGT